MAVPTVWAQRWRVDGLFAVLLDGTAAPVELPAEFAALKEDVSH